MRQRTKYTAEMKFGLCNSRQAVSASWVTSVRFLYVTAKRSVAWQNVNISIYCQDNMTVLFIVVYTPLSEYSYSSSKRSSHASKLMELVVLGVGPVPSEIISWLFWCGKGGAPFWSWHSDIIMFGGFQFGLYPDKMSCKTKVKLFGDGCYHNKHRATPRVNRKSSGPMIRVSWLEGCMVNSIPLIRTPETRCACMSMQVRNSSSSYSLHAGYTRGMGARKDSVCSKCGYNYYCGSNIWSSPYQLRGWDAGSHDPFLYDSPRQCLEQKD